MTSLYESLKKNLKESDYYNWKDDIIDVTDTDDLDLYYAVSENVVDKDEYGEYKDRDRDQAINEFMSNIINLFKIEKRSRLYKYLLEWYGSKEKMLDNVRDVYETSDAIYFVTGSGYSIFDNDLLGGNADGTTEKKFSEFVDNDGKLEESEDDEAEEDYDDSDSIYTIAEKWDGNGVNDELDDSEWKEIFENAPDTYLDALRARESFVKDWWGGVPDHVWDELVKRVEEKIGFSEYGPMYVIDNVIVNGDYGDFDEYKQDGESDEEFIARAKEDGWLVFPEDRFVLVNMFV